MRITGIVAMSENHVIGKNNQLPWHLPADLQHFKSITMGKPIIMGRKTYDSIGRPLPNRINIVITRDSQFKVPGCLVVNSIDAALTAVADKEEIFIIGGAALFEQMLSHIQRLYLTIIHYEFEGDTYFPEIDKKKWQVIECTDHKADEKNRYDYSFIVMDRLSE